MISREQVEEHRKLLTTFERIPKEAATEILDTLSAALEVVEAAKELDKRIDGGVRDATFYMNKLRDALAPFQQEAK